MLPTQRVIYLGVPPSTTPNLPPPVDPHGRAYLHPASTRQTMNVVTLAAVALAAAFTGTPEELRPGEAALKPHPQVIHLRTDGFWLNLHHFLYVLGRAEAGMPDAGRDAVRDAPIEQDSILPRLTPRERQIWREAVEYYAGGISRQDLIFHPPLIRITERLGEAGNDEAVTTLGLDEELAAVLDRAGAVYRRGWWPGHEGANARRARELLPLLEEHGSVLRSFLERVYDIPWPADGFHIHLSAFANWAGAYSVTGSVIVASSFDEAQAGWHGVETLIHESLHQWDGEVMSRLSAAARAQDAPAPSFDLVHAMIFAAAGEAVRQVVPYHVPYADLRGLWNGQAFGPHRERIDEGWRPWLRGEGTLRAAFETLVGAPASR